MQKDKIFLKIKSVDADEGTFEGYASVFDNIDLGNDVIKKGAFARTIKNQSEKVPILWQHNMDEPIGISTEMVEDNHGLKVKGKLILGVKKAREAHELLKAGAIKGLSIGFDIVDESFEKGIRVIKELRLWEFSVVTFGMNPLATVTATKNRKDLEARIEKLENELAALRSFGDETAENDDDSADSHSIIDEIDDYIKEATKDESS